MTDLSGIESMRARLNAVSPSFCLAKWLQVTLHLTNGHTHSCHHPTPHKIRLDELKKNVSALHNTRLKKAQRKLMLEGQRPAECQYCWNIEDAGTETISDRWIKSADPWAEPLFERTLQAGAAEDLNPSYVEVSFSNTCNFKCSYCGPAYSSKWMEEIREHGHYPTTTKTNNLDEARKYDRIPIPEHEANPYVQAFWKWWPDLYPGLKVFRITGGEPLLSRHTFRVLDFIAANPNPALQLCLNSNLGVPRGLLEKMVAKVKGVLQRGCIREFVLYTSLDSWGSHAEYIRHGLVFEDFWRNVQYVLSELPEAQLIFMSTFNALSVPRYRSLLEGVLDLKNAHPDKESRAARVYLNTSYLRYPEHQNVRVLTPEFSDPVAALVEFMNSNRGASAGGKIGFNDVEVEGVSRILSWMRQPADAGSVARQRRDFYAFFREHDRRRGTSFAKSIPELADFWELCRGEFERDAAGASE